MLAERRRRAARISDAPQAVGEVAYLGLAEAARECDLFLRCADAAPRPFVERFMTAASPGIIATTMLNAHYASHEAYVMALARALREEYALIHARGLLLQVDCPDLAMEGPRLFQDLPLERFLEVVDVHVEAINVALGDVPPDRVRLHVCWGNYDGPHTHDVPLEALLPRLYRARVGALSIEMANPRHQHEHRAFRRHPLPDGMLLLPGVIDSTTNFVEHPEVVADRLVQVAEAVGDPRRIIASVDCGFGTFAGSEMVADSVIWAKLRALRDGARLASERLFR
jgi:5-methyltetrahydropteroyltriglutamate--homocysteine methyltransferase